MRTRRIAAEFEVHDERFAQVGGDDHLEVLYDGGRWLEGPVYSPAWRSVLFSDIPNDRVLRWDETTGRTGVFTAPAGFANGRTLDRQGRVITCSQGARAVVRTEVDGSTTVLADRWNGKRLNSPNDVVVRADGTIWFTDPSYGIDSDYEGHRAASETDGCHVYRIRDGVVDRVADDFDRPNGLAFNADEDQLHIVDTRRHHVRRFDVSPDGELSGGDVLATCEATNAFDGLRVDHLGRLWVAAHDGLHCFDPDGTLLGKLLVPEVCANLAFGGQRGTLLFITASTTLYSIMVNFTEAVRPPAKITRDPRTPTADRR
ncbi:SMP-30/gluconolactonase/LRE family protein [Propionibacteriaceae bacterium Y1700]|uniref:SMP-30/gluconolactonase/LRE family protein n=1 Tax=Microlunatus sp. Y1700 TaxID=3418487 RepID=UPI003DA715C6